ncbi:hypothetical protein DAPPUDRAFT_233996 [Daphnia pulex]|uniref:Uncharacterized protein n=1 Tax=Daphnia pulex TaxID=6669 RepID=E9FUB0_DAPPU|nr:hypothetical protein DAPPUDRAFT_233996 [Daphnia pulex]|eukprot:EFX88693.1 hypothetical protein DAPPUDRAFT_233996 [Daphnia pulex]
MQHKVNLWEKAELDCLFRVETFTERVFTFRLIPIPDTVYLVLITVILHAVKRHPNALEKLLIIRVH